MRNLFSAKEMIKFSMPILLAMAVAILAGCGAGGASTASTSGGPTTVTNDAISLATSVTSIKTDTTSIATLTATVTKSNAVVSGIVVTFATTSGTLSSLTATSDSSGKATVTLSSGTSDYSNRTATVTASAGGFSANIPVLINGSTLTLTPSSGSEQVGTASPITLYATAKNANTIGVIGQSIRFSIDATSTGAATLAPTTNQTTGVIGTTPNVTLTPTAAGTVVVDADWLDSTGAVSVRATQTVTVTAALGIAFAITNPLTDPLSLATSATQALAVTVPTTIGGTTVASVRTTATGGTWTGTAPATATAASITQVPAANAVASTFTAPSYSGVITVQVDALDATSAVLSTLTRTFVVSAPAASAATLSLGTSAAIIVPSSGSNASTATLTAHVVDASPSFSAVGNAAVMFVLFNTTGTGESISPAVAYTDGNGNATATFTAGSSSTAGPIYARALVVGNVCTGTPQTTPPVAETNPLCSSIPLHVSAQAVSISIGFGTTISDTANATQYLLPGSILVVDGSGAAVKNANVTLSVFPYQYRNGSITDTGSGCIPPVTSFTASEDVNRNGSLDPGEDTPALQSASQIAAGAISLNGILSPLQADGGSVPASVTTDSNGSATFNLQYFKQSAFFIRDEVTATVNTSSNQGSATTTLTLPMSATDAKAVPCSLARTATY